MKKRITDDRGASVDEGNNGEAVDEFEQVFDQAIEDEVSGKATSVDDDDQTAGGTAGESGELEAGSGDTLTETSGATGTAGKVEDYEQKYKTLQGIFKRAKDDWENEKKQLASKQSTQTQGETAEVSAKGQAPVDKRAAFMATLTDDQKEQLKEYEKEFGVISHMEGMKREYELATLKKEFGEFIVAKLNEIVLPMAEEIDRTTEEGHFKFLKEQHPDFETYVDNGVIQEWINSKPGYLRRSLQSVYDAGETQDVADLISDFKKENNLAGDDSRKAELEAERQRKAGLAAKRIDKRKALTSVDTNKGAVAASNMVATDFSEAFDEALNAIG